MSERIEMPLQAAEERSKNYEEVALGYTAEQAIAEAKRCIKCKAKPCTKGCPVGVDIPTFISYVACGDFESAYRTIEKSNVLPSITGRVCPQEVQCEMQCTLGKLGKPVAIGNLERFVADWHSLNAQSEHETVVADDVRSSIKVAVIGSGPSGLTAAGELKKKGYDVTVFEALHKAGGVLSYGIPKFRLPESVTLNEIEKLKQSGVKIICNAVAGKAFGLDELFEDGFKAIYIASGAGLPKFMGIEGENLVGVFSANEVLTRINLMNSYLPDSHTPGLNAKKVVVVGGGNVAMDAARCALRSGAEVTIVYRRTEKELPARREEVEHAKQEGVKFLFLENPVRIEGENGICRGITVQQMQLGEPDSSGRARPVPVLGSEHFVECDAVIMALGTSPNPTIKNATKALATDRHGCITVDENEQTSIEGVFAGGDAVTGAATVILAMSAGKKAAQSIDEYISEKYLNK